MPQDPKAEVFDEEESPDVSSDGFDLTPRDTRVRSSGSTRRYVAVGALVLAAVVLGIVVFNGLNDASMFYYNVDEAVAKRDDLGSTRFRMQGNVIDGTIEEADGGVEFDIAFEDEHVHVRNTGNPPELFSPEIPVILEGRFVGDEFHSDEIIIRHDSTYDEEHEDRIDKANKDAKDRAGDAG